MELHELLVQSYEQLVKDFPPELRIEDVQISFDVQSHVIEQLTRIQEQVRFNLGYRVELHELKSLLITYLTTQGRRVPTVPSREV